MNPYGPPRPPGYPPQGGPQQQPHPQAQQQRPQPYGPPQQGYGQPQQPFAPPQNYGPPQQNYGPPQQQQQPYAPPQQQQQPYAPPQQQPYAPPPQQGYGQPQAPPPQRVQPSPPQGPTGAGPTPLAVRPGGKPLARLPLQIGTAATWSAGRAAVAIFPGLFCTLLGVITAFASNSAQDDPATLTASLWPITVIFGPLLLFFGVFHLRGAIKMRASDLLLHADGLTVDGGRLHGTIISWQELTPPFAMVERTTGTRLVMWRIFAFTLWLVMVLGSRGRVRGLVSPVQKVDIWQLWIWRRGQRQIVAESERPIEADSMAAAASSIEAVMNGRNYVQEAPTIAAQVTVCGGCGAPAIPDDAQAVQCVHCKAWVQLPPQVRSQAAAAKAMQQSRVTQQRMVAKLVEQPRAANSNGWLLFFTLLMFGAWPLGWGLTAWRVLADGLQGEDVLFLALPFAAVLGGFFFARARLADRGALQMLTLGFGALAPRRDGDPSRCRRCQGPLPDAELGGVSQCRYCHAENIVGLDLRPSVDPARSEQHNFDEALKKRGREKAIWGALTVVAVIALLGWLGGMVAYALA